MSGEAVRPVVGIRTHSAVPARPSRPIATILLCSNPLSGIGLQHLLAGTDFAVSGKAPDEAALSRHNAETEPELLIIDGGDSLKRAVETGCRLKSSLPGARIVVIADQFDPGLVLTGHEAGIDGFCLSASSREVLVKSLELIMLGEAVLPSALACSMLGEIPVDGPHEPLGDTARTRLQLSDSKAQKLSNREVEILGCLVHGAPNKVIARTFNIAEATVKVHIKAILRRIGVMNRTQAAIWAVEHLPMSMDAASKSLANDGESCAA